MRDAPATTAGSDVGGGAHRPDARLRAAPAVGPARSRCSSTTARSRARSPSSGCSTSGEHFADRLLGALDRRATAGRSSSHIATDGETYGHHHRHGDMALAYALDHIEATTASRAHQLRRVPRAAPAAQRGRDRSSNTSWSCAHGVERWRTDCGCNSGGTPGLEPDAGARRCAPRSTGCATRSRPLFEERGRRLRSATPGRRATTTSTSCSTARPDACDASSRTHARARARRAAERVRSLKLLEMQRHAMLMYTSCGWFFDELSGIETVQVLQYAGRAVAARRGARAGPGPRPWAGGDAARRPRPRRGQHGRAARRGGPSTTR